MSNVLILDFLRASQEAIARQEELAGAVARHLGVPVNELFSLWMKRECEQSGELPGPDWRYSFHGFECDIYHRLDGRFVRIDFGPHGRTDIFSGWGILQFVMSSKSPWREFPELRSHLAAKPPPHHYLSGSHDKMMEITDEINRRGLVVPADPALCRFKAKHTRRRGNDWFFSFPKDTSQQTYLDMLVCQRLVLSEEAKQLVAREIRLSD